MPKCSYALKANGPKRLEVSWGIFWKNFTIRLDGNEIGTISTQRELRAGQKFTLPDDSTLHVQLFNKALGPELQLLLNGAALPGSSSDPSNKVKTARNIVFWIAGLNTVLGLVAVLFEVALLSELGIGAYSILFGLVFLVLGFWMKRGSAIALILATVLLALDGSVGIVSAVAAGYTPGVGGLVARIWFIILMIQGISAMQTVKQETASTHTL